MQHLVSYQHRLKLDHKGNSFLNNSLLQDCVLHKLKAHYIKDFIPIHNLDQKWACQKKFLKHL